MRGQRVLVTGGGGYIGSHILLRLEKVGCDVTVVDNLSTGREEGILYGKAVIEDIGNTRFLDELMKANKFTSVIHLAGSIVVPESVENPTKYYENNTANSFSLIRMSAKYGVKNFLFSSTAAVYGLCEGGYCDETTNVAPLNPYGRSKLVTEWMLEDICRVSNLNSISLRYFNVAGANIEGRAGQCSPFSTHLIKVACETALGKRDKIAIFGDDYDTPDGTCIRDYIHVDDLAEAHIDCLSYLDQGGASAVFNCGYGQGTSVKDVISTVKKISRNDFKVETVGRRAGDASKLVAKSDKIKSALGWCPRYNDLDTICTTALEWEKNL